MPTKKNTKQTAKKSPATKAAKKTTPKKVTKKSTKKTPTKSVKTTAKKTSKKATKKTTAKASAHTKAAAKNAATTKLLVCAEDGHCFWTTDGQVLRDLQDLKVALGQMDDMVFMYHVGEDKNDFADWVEHVLQDAACADALRACQTPKKATKVVTTHLQYYTF